MYIKNLKEMIENYSDDTVVVALNEEKTNYIELTDMYLTEDNYINAYGKSASGKIFVVC